MTVEVVRRDPDHDMRDAIDRHGLPDDVGVGRDPAPPEVVAQDDARLGRWRVVDCGVKTGSAGERHAKRAEVAGRDVECGDARRGLRLIRGLRPELAELPGPPRQAHAGIGIPQRLIVRVRPPFERPDAGPGPEGTDREHEELGQALGIDAARRRRDRAIEGHECDERTHADAERHDADQRERPLLDERPDGMRQVAPDRMEGLEEAPCCRETLVHHRGSRPLAWLTLHYKGLCANPLTSAVRREFLSPRAGSPPAGTRPHPMRTTPAPPWSKRASGEAALDRTLREMPAAGHDDQLLVFMPRMLQVIAAEATIPGSVTA